MMHMTFYNGVHVTLWVDGLSSSTLASYLGLVLLVVLFGVAHEALFGLRRACMQARTGGKLRDQGRAEVLPAGAGATELLGSAPERPGQLQVPSTAGARVVDAMALWGGGVLVHVLYGLNVATSYLLMLAAMTFNVGIFAAVCTGMAVGHWFFLGSGAAQAAALSDACCAQPA